jgi:polygalacturonase
LKGDCLQVIKIEIKMNIKIVLIILLAAGLYLSGFAQRTSYNIMDFGAVNDGVTNCTEAFNKVITACSENGGGTVIVPAGNFKSGTIQMKDNVELHLEIGSTLLASTKHEDFPRQPQPEYRSYVDRGGWYALIYAEGASNIAITGLGIIDGDGAQQKPRPGSTGADVDGRPRNILFISCKRVRVEGIKMINSGIWNQHYLNCEDVIVDRVEVYNHSNRNNDAIDIDGCRRVTVSNSIFDTDDDGITLKSTGLAATEDVVITNCVVSSFCNAIKAGTESTGGFRNITISNCVIKPSRSTTDPIFRTSHKGITGISLEIVDGGTMEGITISNITIEGTQCPLYIRLGNRARKHTVNAPEPPVGIMRNIAIKNVVAYNTDNFSNSITAIPGHYVENVNIEDVQFFNKGGLQTGDNIASHLDVKEDEKGYPQPTIWGNLPSSVLFIRHVKNVSVSNLKFGSDEPDSRIPVIAVDVKNLEIGKVTYMGSSTPESFVLLDHVEEYNIEKPLGWGERKLIKKNK